MKETERNERGVDPRTTFIRISRRTAVGSSALGILGLLSGSVLAREPVDSEALREARERAVERTRAVARRGAEEALRRKYGPDGGPIEAIHGSDMETRVRMMQDRQLQRMLDRLKSELGISDEEWTVIKPRIETVYRLVHMPPSAAGGDAEASVTRRTQELRELLANKEATPEDVKARLTLLRAAKEQTRRELVKARQNLQQILTLRQEAVLVLYGLLE